MAEQTRGPIRVAYDICRLSRGGANGGIKVHHYEFLRCFAQNHSHELQLHVFCQEELVPELDFLNLKGTPQIHVLEPDGELDLQDLLTRLKIDVLYAGFGFSRLSSQNIPQISLIVDVLHRNYPSSLPPAEVEFRDCWYREAVARSQLVQTNSESCKNQLVTEFEAASEQVFTIALPLQKRFERVASGLLPSQISRSPGPYFLYPANYWPHKNHEGLLIAFASFLETTQNKTWQLVLTGAASERTAYLQQIAQTLGIAAQVHFVDHQSLSDFKRIWESAYALVFTSLYEGFGLPILEAMHFKKRIACGRYASSAAHASEKIIGFDPKKPSEIAQALQTLATMEAAPDWTTPLAAFQLDSECRKIVDRMLSLATPPLPST